MVARNITAQLDISQPPLQLGEAMWLSSHQWGMRGSDIFHSLAWILWITHTFPVCFLSPSYWLELRCNGDLVLIRGIHQCYRTVGHKHGYTLNLLGSFKKKPMPRSHCRPINSESLMAGSGIHMFLYLTLSLTLTVNTKDWGKIFKAARKKVPIQVISVCGQDGN